MFVRSRVPVEETVKECHHPDANLGEIWVTNKPADGAARYAQEHNYRVGTTAYNKVSAVVSDFQPIFGPAVTGVTHFCQGYCNHRTGSGLKV